MEIGRIFAYLLGITLSGGLFFMGVLNVKDRYSCKEKVNAVCVELYTTTRQNIGLSNAVFEFNYGGKKRHSKALEDLKRREWNYFKEGETYIIYVNPKRPELSRCTKTILRLEDLIMLLFGGFPLLAAIGAILTSL